MLKIGKLLITCGIKDKVAESTKFSKEVLKSLKRYCACDWKDMCEEDRLLNDEAIKNNDMRILAAYKTLFGKIWIITESDHSYTTILFPHEY